MHLGWIPNRDPKLFKKVSFWLFHFKETRCSSVCVQWNRKQDLSVFRHSVYDCVNKSGVIGVCTQISTFCRSFLCSTCVVKWRSGHWSRPCSKYQVQLKFARADDKATSHVMIAGTHTQSNACNITMVKWWIDAPPLPAWRPFSPMRTHTYTHTEAAPRWFSDVLMCKYDVEKGIACVASDLSSRLLDMFVGNMWTCFAKQSMQMTCLLFVVCINVIGATYECAVQLSSHVAARRETAQMVPTTCWPKSDDLWREFGEYDEGHKQSSDLAKYKRRGQT